MKKIDVKSVDLEKLKTTFTGMNNDRGLLGLALLEEITFQQETLVKMREEIATNSLTAEYSNYKRSNPIIAGYNAMINNYSKLIRQAVELLPNEQQTEVSAEDFLNEEY